MLCLLIIVFTVVTSTTIGCANQDSSIVRGIAELVCSTGQQTRTAKSKPFNLEIIFSGRVKYQFGMMSLIKMVIFRQQITG